MNKSIYTLCILGSLIFSRPTLSQKLDLKYTDYARWTEQLSQYQPDIVVVDFWATWCSSCLDRFPHMVEMSESYGPKGVQFISMLLEDPEEPEAIERAKQFLISQFKQGQNTNFDHYFMTENLMLSFEKLDLIGIPAVFIYGRQGQLAHQLTGDNPNNQFTETDIQMALDQMLITNDL